MKKYSLLVLLYLLILTLITSCGGGGGGGGAVSFSGSNELHNGGGNSGWGAGNQTGNGIGGNSSFSSGSNELLFESFPSFFYPIDHMDISLNINGTPAEFPGLDTTAKKDVLGLKNGDKVSGTLFIYLAGEESPRVAVLDETEITLTTILNFKVPYKYRAYSLSNELLVSGEYFSRDGIDLSAKTVAPIAGWRCDQNGTRHSGGIITGVRGDIDLYAVDSDTLFNFEMSMSNAQNVTWDGDAYNAGTESGIIYTLDKYDDDTKELKVSITNYSAVSNLSVNADALAGANDNLDISTVNASGVFTVKIKTTVRNSDVSSSGDIYKLTVTDNGTGAVKSFWVKVIQPPVFTYSVKYQDESGVTQSTSLNNVEFTPEVPVEAFATSITKLGHLITGLPSYAPAYSIPLDTWKISSDGGTNYTAMPFTGSTALTLHVSDCNPSTHDVILLAVPVSMSSLCRTSDADVTSGDVVLSDGRTVSAATYTANTWLNSSRVGVICKNDSNGEKWVVGAQSNNNYTWANNASAYSSALHASVVNATESWGTYIPGDTTTIDPVTYGNNLTAALVSALIGTDLNDFPAFKYCDDFNPIDNAYTGSYASGWYLPSLYEGFIMYKTHSAIGITGDIPTSNQDASGTYWCINLANGQMSAYDISTNVRKPCPCHAFTFVP